MKVPQVLSYGSRGGSQSRRLRMSTWPRRRSEKPRLSSEPFRMTAQRETREAGLDPASTAWVSTSENAPSHSRGERRLTDTESDLASPGDYPSRSWVRGTGKGHWGGARKYSCLLKTHPLINRTRPRGVVRPAPPPALTRRTNGQKAKPRNTLFFFFLRSKAVLK